MISTFRLAASLSLCCVILVVSEVLGAPAHADAGRPGERCLPAAKAAAARHGVPLRLLWSIGLTESGHRGTAWPWTLNTEGRGRWFDTRAEAASALAEDLAAGRWNIDIGCFQISTRWHGMHFASPAAMLDPDLNADYAARFLAALKSETGDWESATGFYHSRTPRLAAAYRRRVARRYQRPFRGEKRDSAGTPLTLAKAPLPPARGSARPSGPHLKSPRRHWLTVGSAAPWFATRLPRAPVAGRAGKDPHYLSRQHRWLVAGQHGLRGATKADGRGDIGGELPGDRRGDPQGRWLFR
ncbi:MAG: hypothetical protein AAF577_06005 [Pseudomonadota bacterium]